MPQEFSDFSGTLFKILAKITEFFNVVLKKNNFIFFNVL